MVIGANDNAAGIVGLADNSRSVVAAEGEMVVLTVERSVGNLGVVEVDWEIVNATREFVMAFGTSSFEDVRTIQYVCILVLS